MSVWNVNHFLQASKSVNNIDVVVRYFLSVIFFVTDYGGDFVGDSGEVFSPGYPNSYPHNLDVVYTITGTSADEILVITFLMIDMEAATLGTCRYDYLAVSFFVSSQLLAKMKDICIYKCIIYIYSQVPL